MRLVIATPLYPPEIGGPATYASVLFRELPKQGIEVELVKFSDVRRLPKIVRHFAYYKKLTHALAGADALLALDPVSVGLPALFAAQRCKKPLVVKVVGDYAWEQGTQRFGVTASLDAFVKMKNVPLLVRVLQKIQTRIAAFATRVIVPSEYLQYIVSRWGIPEENISVIYNAVPFDVPGAMPKSVAELPRPHIVSVGRLVPWKGFEGLIDAVAALREQGIHASLVIVGDGPDRASLTAYARTTLGAQGVCFTGQLSHSETLAVIKNADVLALNSSYEGLSHLLIEALSLGTPVVATRVGGNGEVITDEENGLLIPLGDSSHLAAALKRIIEDSALRERLSKCACESSIRFAEETMVRKTVELLKKL